MSTDRDTVRSYDAVAAEYAAEAAAMPEWVATEIDVFVTALGGSRSEAGAGEMHWRLRSGGLASGAPTFRRVSSNCFARAATRPICWTR
ncbi:hypothetical protein EDE05_10630 [Neorhizobium sp. R1-B]|nr:hypothetical protein EDE05_10630 [Neorhizobium sp. R1-B]